MKEGQSRARVVIEGVKPEIDAGRFPIKRTLGEKVVVEADAFADGHDEIACVVLFRAASSSQWTPTAPMTALANDRWRGEFSITRQERYFYTVAAWVDHFKTWSHDLRKRLDAGQDVAVELLIGANLIEEASSRAQGDDADRLRQWAGRLSAGDPAARSRLALEPELVLLTGRYPDPRLKCVYPRELVVEVDRAKARYSTWYELFPRSCSATPGGHGTFRDCEARLPYVAGMGFDVVYLPPIHPIGATYRKGRNNAVAAGPGDPGSPWGIGAKEGGHKSIHPKLGTLEDFRRLLGRARELGMEIALDIAFQCSPDHPYVKEHPEWFRLRPDGTIQYAENPPKKYQDIYPLNFETERRQELWDELKSVIVFWIGQGVRIFRIDNPHTKPFAFWEWLIGGVKKEHPDVIFLSEAFTRPKIMYQLAKLGFTQSYTYFAWRNSAWELTQYFTELTQTDVKEYFRPNLWPNTPDILTDYLQHNGRPAFMARLVLAATLGANYGIYGPAFELLENRAIAPGKEEYYDSEKYEIKQWNIDRPDSLREFITLINRIRRENPALQTDRALKFHPVDNHAVLCYSKQAEDQSNLLVMVVSVDPHHTQSGHVTLPLEEFGIDPHQPYQVHDLLGDAYYLWHGHRNFVRLNPHVVPAHIFRLRHRVRTERDFDYYS